MADGFNLPGRKRNRENALDGSFSGSSRSPLSTVDQNSPLAFVMGTTTKGCNVTPLSTWHFNGNHGHDFNSQITSTGFDRTPISSIGPNNAPGHVLETQERGIPMFVFLDPWIIVAELARLCLVTAYKSDSHNLKYIGIDALGRLIKISPEIVEHQLAGANGALSAEARLAKVKVDADFIAPCDTSILYPTDGGNMHCFTVVTQCAVLDVLGPPYNDAEGRHCAYYIEHPLDHISGIYSLFLG
ncbi:hypothetical protein DCAR_0626423 [Daucus carota subsp. sativus]|uniref:cysteine dioxygenase n=1 Tax=Daucus carota subsp. sativus TaxID=79200 RepID=A0AAF1B552_DAUCS|nr:hypothetical protein DCAR_0626423 [Daucus carota subsp. sativus]